MITKFKIFESNGDDVDYILKKYEECILDTRLIEHLIKRYKIPTFLYDDFCLLYWFYAYTRDWKIEDKKIDNRVKRNFKKFILEKISNYFNDNIELYLEFKKLVDDINLSSISNICVKYVFYMFNAAVRKTPEIIKNINKYNI